MTSGFLWHETISLLQPDDSTGRSMLHSEGAAACGGKDASERASAVRVSAGAGSNGSGPADSESADSGSGANEKDPQGATGDRRESRVPASVVCFSHLRWNFVYQRPQHLMTRAAAQTKVYYIEEPLEADVPEPRWQETASSGVVVLTPLVPHAMHGQARLDAVRKLLDGWTATQNLGEFVAWYYTPMALLFSEHLQPAVTVYDCMDQLSAFRGAPPELLEQERLLFDRAQVVFAGGRSLFEAKRSQHANVHLFPSSVDQKHFGASRGPQDDPDDQRAIPHPRIGFFGVLDERFDQDLLREMAAREPSWHFVLIGPVVKIDPNELPHAPNLHYLGQKQYGELPRYLAHWDVAMLPFALNEATRFISPTKTPEYLAAGKPVVATPVADVVEPYGALGLARIAANADEFCEAIRQSLEPPDPGWLNAVENQLRKGSWDRTFEEMWGEVLRARATQKRERVVHV